MKLKEELLLIASDCEECAEEAEKLQGNSAATGEKRAWLSVAHRIRYAAKRVK